MDKSFTQQHRRGVCIIYDRFSYQLKLQQTGDVQIQNVKQKRTNGARSVVICIVIMQMNGKCISHTANGRSFP